MKGGTVHIRWCALDVDSEGIVKPLAIECVPLIKLTQLQNCPDPMLRNSKKRGCDRCGARDHPENVSSNSHIAIPVKLTRSQSCPSLWRQYAYYSPETRLAIQKTKRDSREWQKEAIGGDEAEEWCYNCAREGHLGDVS